MIYFLVLLLPLQWILGDPWDGACAAALIALVFSYRSRTDSSPFTG